MNDIKKLLYMRYSITLSEQEIYDLIEYFSDNKYVLLEQAGLDKTHIKEFGVDIDGYMLKRHQVRPAPSSELFESVQNLEATLIALQAKGKGRGK